MDEERAGEDLAAELETLRARIAALEAELEATRRTTPLPVVRAAAVERRLRESEARWDELADLMPQTMFETDLSGTITYCNRAGFEAFRNGPEDLALGLNAVEFVVPSDRARAAENVARRLAGERLGAAEYTALRKDGSTFACLIIAEPFERGGEVVGLRGLAVDISRQKQAERELARRNEELLRANQTKDAFIATVSHELRTPLVTGLGYLELLLEGRFGKLGRTATANMQVALRNLRRLATLVDDILAYGELLERGDAPFPGQRTDLCEVAQRVARALEAETGRARGSIVVACPAGPVLVEGDEAMIEAALAALADNAHRHGGEGAVIRVSVELCGPDRVEVAVADDGPGMTEEVRARAFEPFFRGSQTREGAGLGLAYARRAFAAHGAPVTLETEAGSGTRVTVSLRLAGRPTP